MYLENKKKQKNIKIGRGWHIFIVHSDGYAVEKPKIIKVISITNYKFSKVTRYKNNKNQAVIIVINKN